MAFNIIKNQEDLHSRLQKAHSNYKKSPRVRITKAYVQTRINTLDGLLKEFMDNHKQLIQIVVPEQIKSFPYFEEDICDSFQEIYTEYMTDLKEKLEQFESSTCRENQAKAHSVDVIKLPRIQLPSFSGKYSEWQTFYDLFCSVIHNNEKLSPAQKLHYLKSSIVGEPLNLIGNYSTTDLNYEEAWNQLVKRYNNKRYNSNAILKTLFSQKTISESSSAIKQLLDTTTSCLKALDNMGISTASWDSIVIYLTVSKIDLETHKQWENHINNLSDDLPTWSQFVEFLEGRFRSLEMVETGKQLPKPSFQVKKHVPKTFHAAVQENIKKTEFSCPLCGENHYINLCKQFRLRTVQQRRDFALSKGLCYNCLQTTHVVNKCRQSTCCKKCGRRHNTLLHIEREGSDTHINNVLEEVQNGEENPVPSTSIVANFAKHQGHNRPVLLATAVVKAQSRSGNRSILRVLLDQGSQASFITEAAAQLLNLKKISVNNNVSGLGDGQMHVKYLVILYLESRHNPECLIRVNAYVLRSLTDMLPCDRIDLPDWKELSTLELADPGYTVPGKIDLLVGAEVYSDILLDGLIKQPKGKLIAQNTAFGWVLSGKMSDTYSTANITSLHLQVKQEDGYLKRFWEIEAEPDRIQKRLSVEEQMCENLYEATTTRNENGRFIATLPFKNKDPECQYGQSMDIAMKRLVSLERRLSNNFWLREEYTKVIEEYLTLGYMSRVAEDDVDNSTAVYLPHHAVVRDDKETTKVRGVFSASSKADFMEATSRHACGTL
ncbi:uncharacterized protein LOC125053192 [Pieris napi]|uniref:uncharacterized protein LOC125053192 n=1 Tax=Pieris napi TaxID=78633 RepID=UPI001FB91C7C|nr:uncharacterized protein LOC125053192 [Pieris napi]